MDSLTLIVSSLSAGAIAAANSTVQSIVKDTYEATKAFMKKKFGDKVPIENLEKNPNSESKRASLKEDLESVDAANDMELIEQTYKLIEVLKQHAPETKVIGVNLQEVEAEFLKIKSVHSIGTGINIIRSRFKGGIDVGDVTSGESVNPI